MIGLQVKCYSYTRLNPDIMEETKFENIQNFEFNNFIDFNFNELVTNSNLNELLVDSNLNEVFTLNEILKDSKKLSNPIFSLENCDNMILLNLFNHFFEIFNKHYAPVYVVNMLKQYFKDYNLNPVDIFQKLINLQCISFFTSLIGYFGQFGIGTDVNYQLAISSYIHASKFILNTSTSTSCDVLLCNLVRNNRFISQISLAYLYFSGIGVKEDINLAFSLYNDAAINNFGLAQFFVGQCFENGYGDDYYDDYNYDDYNDDYYD
ncbi:14012_t:CDS:2 [Cetraspora pellucida]|uniref:14012_t:CDS:1 n=1 Tax=Cetraspora pellucida TaxID=1433469 RepID=A0A9N8W1Q7_9GLOM|nr:14012_t:CDS:2 [Cetraspora pellucida]